MLWKRGCVLGLQVCCLGLGGFGLVNITGGLLLPTVCPFRAFQAASKDRPWDNYRHFALFRTEGVLAYVHWWLCAIIAVNSVCAGEQHTCQTCVRPRNVTSVGIQSSLLSLLSYLFFHSEIQECPCFGAADVNAASRQPTSRQNICSEVADDAWITRKWRVTALTTVRCVGVSWVLSTWRVINSITGHTFWKLVTGWKPVNRLTG